MAEEIPKEELEAPQKINEAAIQELINLWLMDYKPADTLDPNTNQIPTSKAIYDYLTKHIDELITPHGRQIDIHEKSFREHDTSRGIFYKKLPADIGWHKKTIDGIEYLDLEFFCDIMSISVQNVEYFPGNQNQVFRVPIMSSRKKSDGIYYGDTVNLQFIRPLRNSRGSEIIVFLNKIVWLFRDSENGNAITLACTSVFNNRVVQSAGNDYANVETSYIPSAFEEQYTAIQYIRVFW